MDNFKIIILTRENKDDIYLTMKINTKKIRFEIERLGWTPYRLSKEMRMANQTVYKILNSDGTGYTFRTVEKFASVLNLDAKDLIQ